MAKRPIGWRINDALIERLKLDCRTEGRRQVSIVEQALAEYLNVPLANRDLPEQPVELCPRCLHGVLNNRRCDECGWHRDPRRTRDATVRARVTPTPKHSKRAKETA